MLRSSAACPNFTRAEPIQLHDRSELGAAGWRCHARPGPLPFCERQLRLNLEPAKEDWSLWNVGWRASL